MSVIIHGGGAFQALKEVDLEIFEREKLVISEQSDRYPAQLSGGQQQRVAIARSRACRLPRP